MPKNLFDDLSAAEKLIAEEKKIAHLHDPLKASAVVHLLRERE
jgi:hypothetical protein